MKLKCTKEDHINCTKEGINIIGIDISTGEDMSCISKYCTSCRNAFGFERYNPTEAINIIHEKECPICGREFNLTIELK